MRRVCAAVAVLCLSCFSADDRVFPCDESHGCPSGQTCQGNLCKIETAAPLDAGADLQQGDMSPARCSGDGYPIGRSGAWACLGTFSPAKPASTLCKLGRLCSDITTLISPNECVAAPNPLFGVPGSGTGPSNLRCATGTSGPNFMYFGCGIRSQATKSEVAAFPCRGFQTAHYNNPDGVVYNQADYSLDAQTNVDKLSGVLCCL